MESVLQIFQAGGNLALVAIAVAIYRIEVRLVRLETKMEMHLEQQEDQ